jgi:hypothetical protein
VKATNPALQAVFLFHQISASIQIFPVPVQQKKFHNTGVETIGKKKKRINTSLSGKETNIG